MDSYLMCCHLLFHHLFWYSHCPRSGQWELLQVGSSVCILLWILSFHRYSKFNFSLHAVEAQNSSFSKNSWFLLVENGTWKPRSGCYISYQSINALVFQRPELGCVCVYIIYIHTHTYLFLLYLFVVMTALEN